jgi:hypothetical protein
MPLGAEKRKGGAGPAFSFRLSADLVSAGPEDRMAMSTASERMNAGSRAWEARRFRLI